MTNPVERRTVLRRHLPTLALAGACALTVTLLAPAAWLVAALEGLVALAILSAAAGWGAWPAAWLHGGETCRMRRIMLATALGVGILGFATLGLGMAGGLNRATAWLLVAGGWVLGLAAVGGKRRASAMHGLPASATAAADLPPGSPVAERAGMPGAVVGGAALGAVLGIAICGASLPPGILWDDEGKGYDALVYHLQGPREYCDAGRIRFLGHNVYASFPQQVEILYLLAMQLGGGPLDGAIPSQWLHALLGVSAVLALAAWSPPGVVRWIVAALAGSVPWLAYVGCLAYVELGTLLFAAVAGGLLVEALREPADANRRLIFAAGVCAGLAGGTKYTALALVAAALGVAWLIAARGRFTWRLRGGAAYALGVVLAFSPWLIRNEVLAGNPVYPFGYRWFGGASWSADQDEQWARGHRIPDAIRSPAGRMRMLWNELLAAPMFAPVLASAGVRVGVLPILLIVAIGLSLRTRAGVMLCTWLGLIVLIWAGATHMPGRFVSVAIAPFGLLLGGALRDRTPTWTAGGAVAAGLIASLNAATLVRVWQSHDREWTARGVALAALPGRVDELQDVQPINQLVPADGYAWLIGEARAFYLRPRTHYTVVFNRDPWLAHAERVTPAEAVVWLRTQGVTHVVFSWLEVDRLRGTYGFPELVSREWVAQLRAAGLRRLEGSDDAVELLEVPAR